MAAHFPLAFLFHQSFQATLWCVVKIKFPIASGSLATGGKATAAVCYQNIATYAANKAFDDDQETRWGTNYDTRSAWLEVELRTAMTFDRIWLSEFSNRIRNLNCRRTFHRGTTIGESCELKFAR